MSPRCECACGITEHEFHDQVTTWVRGLRSKGILELATCSITELGFVGILAQTQPYGFTAPTARALLLRMKAQDAATFTFIPDDHDISHIPGWVQVSEANYGGISCNSRRRTVRFSRLWIGEFRGHS